MLSTGTSSGFWHGYGVVSNRSHKKRTRGSRRVVSRAPDGGDGVEHIILVAPSLDVVAVVGYYYSGGARTVYK